MIDHDQQDDRDEVRRLIAARAPELSADEIAEAFAALPDDRAPGSIGEQILAVTSHLSYTDSSMNTSWSS
jgi:hypothetical protein